MLDAKGGAREEVTKRVVGGFFYWWVGGHHLEQHLDHLGVSSRGLLLGGSHG